MGIDNIIKILRQAKWFEDNDVLEALGKDLISVNLEEYKTIVELCRRNKIDPTPFIKKVYMESSEVVQYQMWKDGYVKSCPAGKLIDDIISESNSVINIIKKDYNDELQHCKAYFTGIQNIILQYIANSKESLKIAMAWFTNPVIFNAVYRACKRGIEVKLLINNDLINNRVDGLPFDKLIEAGADLYIAEPPKLIHNKFCIFDDEIVIDGSYNWTILAERNNDENIVVIEHGNVVRSFNNAFNNLLKNNTHVYAMPDRVPERPEYDCCSYRFFNSEEWSEALSGNLGKNKKRRLYKELYKILPEESAREKIPAYIFEEIKGEVEEEKTRDLNLFSYSLNQKTDELNKQLSIKEKEIASVERKTESLSEKKSNEIERYRSRLANIQSRRISQQQKSNLIDDLKKSHRLELARINRVISKHENELDKLHAASDTITEQKQFIESIENSELQGANGLCRINLKWNTIDDLDLHLAMPGATLDSDKDVHYSQMKVEYNGGICTLDHDAIPDHNGENPQENIIWKNKLPDGQYALRVKLYGKKGNKNVIPFSITFFAGKYVKTELYEFNNVGSGSVIDIATLTFRRGKVVTPIICNI